MESRTELKIGFGILLIGVITAVLFSYLTRGTEFQPRTFVALATVQGAFVGIVFSIFILASQVSASEFSPLTLEQLSQSRTFVMLLAFYLISIFFDIYLIQVGSPEFQIQQIPSSWNVGTGIAAGLAAMSLLSLLVARQLLVSLTSPEHLLEQTANDVSRGMLSDNKAARSTDELQPQRTSLLVIERILASAEDRGDEYTVQQAIFYMFKSIQGIIQEKSRIYYIWPFMDRVNVDSLEFSIIFERWEKCIEYAEVGPVDRLVLTLRAHRRIMETLVDQGLAQEMETEISGMTQMYSELFSREYFEPNLLDEFRELSSTVLSTGESSELTQIASELSELNADLLAAGVDGRISLTGERREIVEEILDIYFCNITESVNSESIGDSDCRSFAANTLDQINEALKKSLEVIDETDGGQGAQQNLLVSSYEAAAKTTAAVSSGDELLAERMLIALIEISMSIDRNPAAVYSKIESESKSSKNIGNEIADLSQSIISGDGPRPELTTLEQPPNETVEFASLLMDEAK